jgi:hypothetical protein
MHASATQRGAHLPPGGATTQGSAAVCITPDEVFDVSAGQLAKVASLVTGPDQSRRAAELYIGSDPWSLKTCILAASPNYYTNWQMSSGYAWFWTDFYVDVSCTPPAQAMARCCTKFLDHTHDV